MRSDEILWTGVSSQAARLERLTLAKKAKAEEKKDKRTRLTGGADIILEEIEKERKATAIKLLETIDTKTPPEETKSLIVALNLYRESLNKLSSRVKAIMREQK